MVIAVILGEAVCPKPILKVWFWMKTFFYVNVRNWPKVVFSQNQGFGMWGWNSEMYVVFAYPWPSIPSHFQPILIENLSNPIGIDPKSIYRPYSCLIFPRKYASLATDADANLATDTKIRVVPKSGWYQNQGGTTIRVVPKSGWYHNQGGTKTRVVPKSGW